MGNRKVLSQLLVALLIGLSGVVGTLLLLSQGASAGPSADPIQVGAQVEAPTPQLAESDDPDLEVAKSGSSAAVTAGEALTYTLTVTNNGPLDATGVTVTDTLPTGVTFQSATPSQGNCGGTSSVTCTLNTLAVSDTATVTIVVTVNSSTRGTLSNTAEVSANEPDLTPGNDTATEETTVNAEADLAVTKTDTPDLVIAGETLTYTLTVTNSGPSDATGVTVTDTLPSGITFFSATPSQGSYDSPTGVWTVGGIADDGGATLTLVFTVNSSTTGTLSNSAKVSANEPDPNTANNTDAENTAVDAKTDLTITKSAPATVNAGEQLTYTLTVTNNGPSDATGVTVTDNLPDDVALVSATPSQGTCSGSDPVTCDLGPVASGSSAAVSLTTAVTSPLPNGTILTNSATIDGDQTDPNSGNDSTQAQTTVQSSPVLTITKTGYPDPVDTGGILRYTLLITNSGNENATTVTVTEHYDSNVSFFYSNPDPDAGSGNQVWTFPTLTVGNPETIDIIVQVTSPLPVGTVLTNRATLDSDQTLPVTITKVTSVTSASELKVSKVDLSDPVQAGENLVYFVTYQNSGTAGATDVVITETYDSRVTFDSATPAPEDGTDNVWDIGNLSVGAGGNVIVTVRVNTPLPNGTNLTNRVTIDSAYTSPRTYTETTAVSSAPDLALDLTDQPDPVEAGDPLTYTLRYTNTGNADATGLVITATFDANVSYVTASLAPAGGSDKVWYWEVDDIPGEDGYGELVIQASVTYPLPNGTALDFAAQLQGVEGDFLEDMAQTTVLTPPDLTVEKVREGHEPSLFSPGKLMTFLVTYGNAGCGDAQDVIITTTLPTGTDYVDVGYGWQSSDNGTYTYTVGDLPAGDWRRPNRVYTNTGGSLAPAWSSPETDDTRSVAWGDWDGDGDLDLAVGNLGQPNRVYTNTGNSLVLAWSSSETDNTTSVAWGDWDGDGDPDLVVGNLGQPNRVYTNTGGSLTLAWSSPEETDYTESIAWGDCDGDGDLDLAVGNLGQPNRVYTTTLVTTTTATAVSLVLAWSSSEADNTSSVAWGDWDGDSDLDLAVGNLGQPNRVYTNTGGGLALAWSSSETNNTASVAWGDWDKDGDLDLAVGNTRRTVAFVVRHPPEPQVSAPEFNTPFTIAASGGAGGDTNPADNTTSVYIGVPDLVVVDWTIKPKPGSLQANVPVTFTITLMNQGTGWALNPDVQTGMAGLWVDVFIAPVASYPWERYSEKGLFAGMPALAPGATHALTLTRDGFSEEEIQEIHSFYVKVDNHELYPYGLVPEFNEMNNLGEPIDPWLARMYLPLILK